MLWSQKLIYKIGTVLYFVDIDNKKTFTPRFRLVDRIALDTGRKPLWHNYSHLPKFDPSVCIVDAHFLALPVKTSTAS
jgi:hypothetical protein